MSLFMTDQVVLMFYWLTAITRRGLVVFAIELRSNYSLRTGSTRIALRMAACRSSFAQYSSLSPYLTYSIDLQLQVWRDLLIVQYGV